MIIHSTTITLPAWHQACSELGLKVRLIPHDVVTQWNSTYNMMDFVLKYRRWRGGKPLRLGRATEKGGDDILLLMKKEKGEETMYSC
jgi:hypothetical protein